MASIGAVSFSHQAATTCTTPRSGRIRPYVDNAGLGKGRAARHASNDRGFATEQLFWNRSIDRLLLLPDAAPPDAFACEPTAIGDDGSILVGGQPYTGPLLVDSLQRDDGVARGARRSHGRGSTGCYKPTGTPRLALYVADRFYDGWLGLTGRSSSGPRWGKPLAGHVYVAFSLPPDVLETTMRLRPPDGKVKEVDIKPGEVEPRSASPSALPSSWSSSTKAR